MESRDIGELENCTIKLREDPQRRKEKVLVGCGAGFGGDRSLAALKLLQRVDKLDYLVLECLAERTLADRYQIMMSGGDGFDPRITEWMSLLLPLSMEKGVCIITNMGAVDPLGAQKAILELAKSMSLDITVSVVNEIIFPKSGNGTQLPENAEGMTKGCQHISWSGAHCPMLRKIQPKCCSNVAGCRCCSIFSSNGMLPLPPLRL